MLPIHYSTMYNNVFQIFFNVFGSLETCVGRSISFWSACEAITDIDFPLNKKEELYYLHTVKKYYGCLL